MTTRFSRAKAFAVGAVAILLGVLYAPMQTAAQNAVLVFGSSSGTVQAIKATSNALWVSLQGGSVTTIPFTVNGPGLVAVSTDGLVLQNITAATSGVPVQISPREKWCGTAWNSTGTASEPDCFIAEVLPATVAGTTTAIWQLKSSIAGGAFGSALVSLTNFGGLTTLQDMIVGRDLGVATSRFLYWTSRASFNSPGDSQVNITNNSATVGIGFDVATDGTLKVRTRAQSADGNISFAALTQSGKTTTYNNVATAGYGHPTIYGENISTTQTANFTALTQSPGAVAGRWECTAVVVSDSGTNTGTFQVTLDYVNAGGVTHTADILPIAGAAGTVAATSTDVASKEFFTVAKRFTVDASNTNIVMKVVITGTVSYKVSPRCLQEA